jgi:hypothetical protein
MSSRPRNVDFGPMHLRVGEQDAAQAGGLPTGDAGAADVARFESLLHRERHRERQSDLAVDALIGALAGHDPAALADAETLGAEIEHLWVGTGLRSEREVRVGLREAILPDTSVRLYEAEGLLRVELTCGTSRVADWLHRKLPALADGLGERLQRRVAVAVFKGDGTRVSERRAGEDA